MFLGNIREIKKIYNALSDDRSRKIFCHKLLYSLTGEKKEISDMIYESFPGTYLDKTAKICFYGAGAGAKWITRYFPNGAFIIDQFKKGHVQGHRIISLDEFLQMPDHREYTILVTVGKEEFYEEIEKLLSMHRLNFQFAFDQRQYFEIEYRHPDNSMKSDNSEFFVDGGALDGETTKTFFHHFPRGHAYVFEPNPKQYTLTKQKLIGFSNIEFFPYGLLDRNGTVGFDQMENDAGAARISNSGKDEIEVRKLDDVLGGKKVSFIKMDIEGSELAALRGAEHIIRNQKPKMAICVYHKPEDIWEIPGLLLEYVPEYRFYLRHHSITLTETVLYAVL